MSANRISNTHPAGSGSARFVCSRAAILLVFIGLLVSSIAAAQEPRAVPPGDERDFPPLRGPERPDTLRPPPSQAPILVPLPRAPDEERPAPYQLGVGDLIEVLVIGQPDYSRQVLVRPDGAMSVPGAGTIFVLGRTPEDVGQEIQDKLAAYLRHPVVNMLVTAFGEQRVFVMGEVSLPGEKPYYKGMSVLQALAQAGGLRPSGKAKSVIVLRRAKADEAQYFQLDLDAALKNHGSDMALMPSDIVFVPRSFIGNMNQFVDQYFRQNIAPFTLYLEGWSAFNAGRARVVNVVR